MTRAEEILLFTKIIAGVNHNVTAAILLGGPSTTATQLVMVFTEAIQASTALDAAKLAYPHALLAPRAAFATAHTTEANLKSYLYGAYGAENPIATQLTVTAAPEVGASATGSAARATGGDDPRHGDAGRHEVEALRSPRSPQRALPPLPLPPLPPLPREGRPGR